MKRDQRDPNQPLLFGGPESPVNKVEFSPAKPIDRTKVYACSETPPPLPGEDRKPPVIKRYPREGKRIVARMPVPRPLPEAVAAGHFGTNEKGPIRPSLDEVREITDTYAHKLMDLLRAIRDGSDVAPRDDLQAEFKRSINAYAEDFGSRAAQQLEAYVRKEVGITVSATWQR